MNSDGFRKAGYEMIEFSAVYMETLDKRDPLPHVTPGYLAKILPAEAPQKGESWEAIVKDFEAVALEGMAHWQHSQFFSYFPAGNSWASIMGDIFSNGCAANGTTWESCPVVTELEIIVLDWACKFLGLPSFFLSHFSNAESQGGGSIQTSASDAIMLSMIAARDDATLKMRKKFPDKPRAVLLNQMVAYCSSQCHSSVEKGGMVGTMRLRQLPADEQGGVRGETLRNAIKDAIADGLVPYFYCAILGSTGICAFDDLMEVGPVCKEFDMWMHVDAAYAGSCFSCPEMRYLMQGYQYAWSTNTNTNKWMLCNFDASLHWVRYRDKLVGCLTGYNPDLWNSGASPEFPIVNLKHFALPSTRSFRAFKLWCVMRNYGVTGLQRYCRNHIYLAKLFERYVQRDDRFEVVGPVRVGMTCFRLRSTNDINKQLLDALNLSRKIHMVPEEESPLKLTIPNEFSKVKGLLFCHININSIRNKLDEVKNLLNNNKKIVVFSCTESKLDQYRDLDQQFVINGYNLYRNDRLSDKGGGTITFINSNYKYEIIELKFNDLPDKAECNILKVWKTGLKPILIVTIYNHPKTQVTHFCNFFQDLNFQLSLYDFDKVFYGDFNIDLLKHFKVFDTNIHKFCLISKEFNLWQLISSPTYSGKSLLDHIYVNNKNKFSSSGHFPFAGSDHDLCYTVLKHKINKVPPKTIEHRKFHNIDWDELTKELAKFEWKNSGVLINNPVEVDLEFQRFNNFVNFTLDKFAPMKKRFVKGRISQWFNSDIANLIKERNKLHKKAIKCNTPGDWKKYRIAKNNVNHMITNSKKEYFRKKFKESTDTCTLWDTVNNLTNFRVKVRKHISVLVKNNVTVTDKNEINDILAESFVVHDPIVKPIENFNEILNNYYTTYDYSNSDVCNKLPVQISETEINCAISVLKNDNSNSSMYPSASVFKNCKQTFSLLLLTLFTNIINVGIIPQCFKVANIIPLYKGKGTLRIAKNYRPICILNAYCKIFERFLYNRISSRVNNLLSDSQHAYRKGRSCNTALKIFSNYVYKAIDKPKHKVVAVFVDFSSAFNSVIQQKLIEKLMNEFKMEPWFVSVLNENFRNRVFKIDGGNKYYELPRGICQGSALGPLLFSLYVNSVDKVLTLPHLMYADDLVIYKEGVDSREVAKELEAELVAFSVWCIEHGLKMNIEKTKFMVFHKEKDKSCESEVLNFLNCNGAKIERVYNFKYLGVIFDPHMNFKLHYNWVSNKVCNRLSYLQGIKKYLTDFLVKIMVNAYVHSVIDYALEIWAVQTPVMLNQIQIKIDRFLLGCLYPGATRKSSRNRNIVSSSNSFNCNINLIRKKLDFLSVSERIDYVLLKLGYKDFCNNKLTLSQGELTRLLPKIRMQSFSSEVYKKSVDFRLSKLWNSLPRDCDVVKLSYDKFKDTIKSRIVEKRNDDYVYV